MCLFLCTDFEEHLKHKQKYMIDIINDCYVILFLITEIICCFNDVALCINAHIIS